MTNKEWWNEETASENTSDFLKLKVGDTKLRVLTNFTKVLTLFRGVYPNSKYAGHVADSYVPKEGESVQLSGWAWVIDRETGDLKIAQFGKGILSSLTQLKTDPEYSYDGFPMPYDVTIKNTGDGPNRYSIIPARQNTDVTEAEMNMLNKQKSIKDIISAIVEKQNKGGEVSQAKPEIAYPTEEINPNDIPF